jgi:putative SOS response-associated peptidase YedK
MCGRFNLITPQEVVARFGFMDWTEKRIEPRFNIAPSQEILTIVQQPLGSPFAQTATWGLKPFWFKSDAKRPPPINARGETLTSSPMVLGKGPVGTGHRLPAVGQYCDGEAGRDACSPVTTC